MRPEQKSVTQRLPPFLSWDFWSQSDQGVRTQHRLPRVLLFYLFLQFIFTISKTQFGNQTYLPSTQLHELTPQHFPSNTQEKETTLLFPLNLVIYPSLELILPPTISFSLHYSFSSFFLLFPFVCFRLCSFQIFPLPTCWFYVFFFGFSRFPLLFSPQSSLIRSLTDIFHFVYFTLWSFPS